MIVKQRDNKIQIKFDYDPALVNFAKSLPGRVYHAPTKSWFIPLSGAGESIDRLLEKGFTVDPELLAAVRADQETALAAVELAAQEDTEFTTPLPLFPYQKVGAAFLTKIGSGLLGDDMGLGKTITSLAVCDKVSAGKVLIFCPASVKWQWEGEIKRFVPGDTSTIVIEGNAKERARLWFAAARFYIVNYELLRFDFELMKMQEWDVIVADEATKICNPTAKMSKLIKKLTAKRRIAMTGTPVSNRANEVWNIIDFTNPNVLGNYYGFLQRYCLKNQWGGIYGYQNIAELREKIRRYMIRRLKVDVLPELPDMIVTDLPFDLSKEEKTLYGQIKKEILYEIEKSDIDKIENPMTIQYTLVKMTRLRQLADSMELLGHNERSSKLDILKEKLEETLADPGRKAIVFTQFAQMADILERELAEYQPLKISGTIKEEYRDVVAQFNDSETNRVLIMTSAGQFGLNIQCASVIFHYDQEWSLAKMQQRNGRAHRIGQEDTVLVYNLLAKGTIDYYIKKILHDKAELSGKVLGDLPISMENIKQMLTYE